VALARRAAVVAGWAALVAAGGVARADDELSGAVIFARGASLYQVDARGKGETEIAQLAARVTVRALRCDAAGTVLLADLAGKWAWMPLDGSTRAMTELPCADGPAQLAEDGSSVVCRSPRAANQSVIVELPRGRGARPGNVVAVDVPPTSARLIGTGGERALVWSDATGVWSAPPGDVKARRKLAPDAPARGFLASPDGERAIGVYAVEVFTHVHHTRPGEQLMTLQLDGKGARRKLIRDGVAVEWSRDGEWVLVQDGASACVIRVAGGQYKCWRGFTAASLSSDGRWGLVLGNRDGSKPPAKASRKAAVGRAAKAPAATPAAQPASPGDQPWDHYGDQPWDHYGEPSSEPGGSDPGPSSDDVSVAPPSGPLSLYRVRLEGAFTDKATLLVKVVDGAATWVPRAP
jgi:hypothetical protein